MKGKKLHYCLLIIATAICVFMYADAYLSPLQQNREIVTNTYNKAHRGKNGVSYSYYVNTNGHNYTMPPDLYDNVNIGDTILVNRSVITHSTQKISIRHGSALYTYNVSFMR